MVAGSKPSRAFVITCLITLCIIAVYIRVAGADTYHYSPDEIGYIEMAQAQNLTDTLYYTQFETHPPLGHILRHYWMVISNTPWFLRSMSLLFGLALIPLYYLIGRQLFGAWAGLCCALLITFSHGAIVQSYILRNYTLLLFCLSACLYAYLKWRETPSNAALLAYAFFGVAACLTHVSGLFCVFCIAAVQSIEMLRTKLSIRLHAKWALTNLLIACISLSTLPFWQPVLTYTHAELSRLMTQRLGFFYPFMLMDYFFAYRANGFYAIGLSFLVIYGLCVVLKRIPAIRFYIALTGLSFALSASLVLIGKYDDGSIRCNLWLLPFFIAPIGCALALLCEWLYDLSPKPYGIAAVFLFMSALLYSPSDRFSDPNEYMITNSIWESYTHYLQGLGATHLIIASRGDAFLIAYPAARNPYDYYTDPLTHTRIDIHHNEFTAIMPYSKTWLMFRPSYFNYTSNDLVQMVKNIATRPQLKAVTTLVFTSTLWSSNNTNNLVRCRELDKTIITFPPLTAGKQLTEMNTRDFPVLALVIPKQVFMDELIAPTGKAHHCMDSSFR